MQYGFVIIVKQEAVYATLHIVNLRHQKPKTGLVSSKKLKKVNYGNLALKCQHR